MFSNPLLISSGEQPDRVRVRLLKSFFLQQKDLVIESTDVRRRKLHSSDIELFDEHFYVFEVDAPKQVRDIEEYMTLERASKAAE